MFDSPGATDGFLARQIGCRPLWQIPYSFLTLALGAILAGAAVAGSDAEFAFEHGHWVGNPKLSLAGEIESCMISTHNDLDELLILRLDTEEKLTLGVFEKRWPTNAPTSSKVLILIDHSVLFFGSGLFHSKTELVTVIDDSEHSLNFLGNGRLISVSALETSAVFELAGSTEAITYIKECISSPGMRL
ncbi:hypothetical protein LP7551_04693 [Roseibium album]|nr:hypothetical protein LP7551_04693 [Roseibium album]